MLIKILKCVTLSKMNCVQLLHFALLQAQRIHLLLTVDKSILCLYLSSLQVYLLGFRLMGIARAYRFHFSFIRSDVAINCIFYLRLTALILLRNVECFIYIFWNVRTTILFLMCEQSMRFLCALCKYTFLDIIVMTDLAMRQTNHVLEKILH